jgi:hypothetical protein
VGKKTGSRPNRYRHRKTAGPTSFSRVGASSVTDHNRPHAGTVPAVSISVPVAITVAITITIAIPEAPITIAIAIVVIVREETPRAAEAVIARPATYALDLFDDAELVLCRLNTGSAGKADRIRAVGQQRRAKHGCGAERRKQELVHSEPPYFAVEARTSRLSSCVRILDPVGLTGQGDPVQVFDRTGLRRGRSPLHRTAFQVAMTDISTIAANPPQCTAPACAAAGRPGGRNQGQLSPIRESP